MAIFNEDSRVKIPALLHLSRLGYRYLSLKTAKWDPRCNIFPELFEPAFLRINPGSDAAAARRQLDEIRLELQNDDLGKAFHKRLIARSGARLSCAGRARRLPPRRTRSIPNGSGCGKSWSACSRKRS